MGMGGMCGASAVEELIWVEAENFTSSNIIQPGRVVNIGRDGSGVSAGLYLGVDGKWIGDSSGVFPFAEYTLEINNAATCRLWLSCSPSDQKWASGIQIQVDDEPWVNMRDHPPQSEVYGVPPQNFFSWTSAGTFQLKVGKHKVRIEIKEPREMDGNMTAFIDALFFTTDLKFRPEGNHPTGSPQTPLKEILKNVSFEDYLKSLEEPIYQEKTSKTQEDYGESVSKDVLKKIMLRPLPPPGLQKVGAHEFGLHGMYQPFVTVGTNTEKINRAYELLARTGIQSFRTVGSCWHHLGEHFDQLEQLDFQVDQAMKYGMSHLFIVGYPNEDSLRVGPRWGAVKSEKYDIYRQYLRTLFQRYQDKGLKYVELGNEVDAVDSWWKNSTPQMYVDEMRIIKEEITSHNLNIKAIGFAATYSRDDSLGAPLGGRAFVRKCFELGIDRYADGYSAHYVWPLAERGMADFFRNEMKQKSRGSKVLMNTEETAYGAPSDIIKLFARNFYLHGMTRVDYYLAQDWFEGGTFIHSGLFDKDWNPKPRLLAYAMSVDSMKYRELLGMGSPQTGVEAYVLKKTELSSLESPPYVIILWKNDPSIKELISPKEQKISLPSTKIAGFKQVVSAQSWNLDQIKCDANTSEFQVTDKPIVIFTKALPEWILTDAITWLENTGLRQRDSNAIIPR
jgi:hypothetical protein